MADPALGSPGAVSESVRLTPDCSDREQWIEG
jgi:hypothetical protein